MKGERREFKIVSATVEALGLTLAALAILKAPVSENTCFGGF